MFPAARHLTIVRNTVGQTLQGDLFEKTPYSPTFLSCPDNVNIKFENV